MTSRTIALVGLVIAAIVSGAPPGQAEESDEFWPEVQVHYWFNEHRSRVIAMGSTSRNRDSDTAYQAEQGLTFEHQYTNSFLGRIGYRHAAALDSRPFTENRLLTEQIFRLYLPSKVIADYRTREDFRWLDTGFSVRLRERIQVSRDFTIADYTFTPYTSAEVTFDTRYGTFSRYRLTLGVTLPIDRHISVEPYLVRQVDWVPAGVITNALGFLVIAAF
jgi:Protein of unknown function (DUF2490)